MYFTCRRPRTSQGMGWGSLERMKVLYRKNLEEVGWVRESFVVIVDIARSGGGRGEKDIGMIG